MRGKFVYKAPVLAAAMEQMAVNDWAMHAESDFESNSILGGKLKDYSVEGVKIRDGTLERRKFEEFVQKSIEGRVESEFHWHRVKMKFPETEPDFTRPSFEVDMSDTHFAEGGDYHVLWNGSAPIEPYGYLNPNATFNFTIFEDFRGNFLSVQIRFEDVGDAVSAEVAIVLFPNFQGYDFTTKNFYKPWRENNGTAGDVYARDLKWYSALRIAMARGTEKVLCKDLFLPFLLDKESDFPNAFAILLYVKSTEVGTWDNGFVRFRFIIREE